MVTDHPIEERVELVRIGEEVQHDRQGDENQPGIQRVFGDFSNSSGIWAEHELSGASFKAKAGRIQKPPQSAALFLSRDMQTDIIATLRGHVDFALLSVCRGRMTVRVLFARSRSRNIVAIAAGISHFWRPRSSRFP